MILAAVALGLLIGLSLGALGGGGSILTVPALVYLLGVAAQDATTASLVIVGVTAVAGAVVHAWAGDVRWAAGTVFGLVGAGASWCGTLLNRAVDPHVLLIAFGVLMAVAATGMLVRARRPSVARAPVPVGAVVGTDGADAEADVAETSRVGRTPRWELVAAGLAVGFLTGFLGVGGGFLIVPALVVVLGFPMPVAVGTSLLVIAMDSAAAMAARVGHVTFDWAVIVPFALAAVVGTVLGVRVAARLPAALLARSFAGLVLAIGVFTVVQSVVSSS